VAAELAAPNVGALNVRPGRAGVSFSGDQATGYAAVLWLRSAVRVLVRLSAGELLVAPGKRGGDALYDYVRRAADWPQLLPRGLTFSVDARVWDCEDLPSEALAATRAKDAICDALRDARNDKPPPPPPGDPGDVPLFLSCHRGSALLYRDLCGVSLHKRGYRQGSAIHRAALNESVAAGMLSLANWQGSPPGLHPSPPASSEGQSSVLVDPMCGSGTLLIEAALMAGGVAPGLLRASWPFQRWPDSDASAWLGAVERAREAGRATRAASPAPPLLLGCDVHAGALQLAAAGAARAGLGQLISFTQADVRHWAPSLPPGARVTHVLTNPPWGGRLQGGGERGGEGEVGAEALEGRELEETWFALGMFLKKRCAGAEAAVLCGNRDAAAKLFLPQKRRHPLTVGGVDCRLLHFTLLPPKQQPDAQEAPAAV